MARKNLGFLGFPKYDVDDCGNVYSLDYRRTGKEHKMKCPLNTKGYCQVRISNEDGKATFRVHRLVALSFIPNPKNYPQIKHMDEDKTNNHVDNLEWCTNEYNIKYNNGIERRSKALKGIRKPTRQKRVEQLDLCGNHIAFFDCLTDAQIITGAKGVSKVCLGKAKTSGGFLWRFA